MHLVRLVLTSCEKYYQRFTKRLGIKKIFDFVEFLLCNGDESVQNGAATCFLEHLFNIDEAGIKFKTFYPYLGKNSVDYCRGWDEFCGMRTEGLWDDNKSNPPRSSISEKKTFILRKLLAWLTFQFNRN